MTSGVAASLLLLALATIAGMLGSIGGLGGAILLIPVLVLLGWSPIDAAPLGMAMVAASTFAAVPRQARSLLTNHRLGVVLETTASVGAALGAAVSVLIAPRVMTLLLGVSAIAAALVGGTRTGQRNTAVAGANLFALRDQPGRLASAYRDEHGGVVPYRPRRVPVSLGLIGAGGLIAGMTGSSGGYIKTPVMSEVMRVPVKVAAATSVFMVGVTASVSLAVYASQGRLSPAIAPAVVGGLIGGRAGASLQPRLSAPAVRRILSVMLIVIGILLVVRS